jgi:hypothetical protein
MGGLRERAGLRDPAALAALGTPKRFTAGLLTGSISIKRPEKLPHPLVGFGEILVNGLLRGEVAG